MRLFVGSRSLRSTVFLFLVAASSWALLFAANPSTLFAQGGVVAGIVMQEGGAPLPNAQVTIRGTRLGAITDANGRFRITGAPIGAMTLDARRLGYRMASQTVNASDENVRLTLPVTGVNLDAVVVTGQPGSTEKRTLGVDVAQIDAVTAVQKAPIVDVQQLINGRAPGVTILNNSGMIGSGATVRIRGVSSFSLSNQPLIYVDGVRVDNAQSTGTDNGGNQGFGANTTSRWNDFTPADIESIEIVRGPAAATLYGTEAANGVIQIITKKGAQGKPAWEFSTRQGVNQFADPEGRLFTNYGRVNGVVDSIDIVSRRNAEGNPIFQSGRLQSYDLGVGGGSPLFRYRVSGNFIRDEGVEATNQLKNYGTRANLSVFPSEKIDLAASLNFVSGRVDLPFEAGGGGLTWGTYFSSPTFASDPRDGFRTAPPEMYHKQYQSYQDIGRFTGSIQINHRPTSWFSHRAVLGTDYGNEYTEELSAVHPDLIGFFGDNAALGYKSADTRLNSLSTLNYSGTIKVSPTPSLSSSTSFGADVYRRSTKFMHAYGEAFPAPGLTAVSSTTLNRSGSENQVENNTVGVFGQEMVGWNDRLFLTAGLRVDNNSSFGANFSRVYYPKYSAAWVVSEEPFFHLPWFNTLKLRAAYGQTGQAPTPYSAVPTFAAVAGPNGSPAVTPESRGNPDLGPERGYETELGFDAGVLQDRAGIELTYYTGGTKNAILSKPVAPSTGYPGEQLVNAGRISKRGLEFLVRASPYQTEAAGWDLTFSAGTNRSIVENLGGDQFIVAPSNNSLIRHQVGYPVGSWFGKRVVDATLDPQGKVLTVICDGGAGQAPVDCGAAPAVYLGRTVPNYEGAFSSTLRFLSNFSLYTLIDFKRGYNKLDGNRRVRCHIFALCRENYFPLEYSRQTIGAISKSSFYSDLIQDASFTKLREVSISYTLPANMFSRLGAAGGAISLSGRNLHTWTKYKGLEPEASFQGGSRGFGQWEQDVTPPPRSIITTLRLTF